MPKDEQKKVEMALSPVKKAILQTIEDVDKKNAGYTSFFNVAAHKSENKNAQLFFVEQMDLPDLIYLHYLIKELNKPECKDNLYKNAVLKTAEKHKKSLLVPLVNQSQQASFGVFLGGMLLRVPWICVVAGAGFLLSEYIAELRLSRQLETELALKLNNGNVAKLDDYDGTIGVIAKFGRSGMHAIERALEYLPSFTK